VRVPVILACLFFASLDASGQDAAPNQTTVSGEARVIDGDSIKLQDKTDL
jgi:hypothetical protein